MNQMRPSSVDWEADIYARGKCILKWPISQVVSSIMRVTAGRDRREVSVLEIGCGAGNNIWFLVSEGFQAHGLDMSAIAIEYARSRLLAVGLEADLKVGDMATLPWKDNRFDVVIDCGALTINTHSHIATILEDVRRVLKPGGVMMSFTLLGMNHAERIYGNEVSYHAFDHFRDGYFRSFGLISFFTRDDLTTLFSRFGKLEIERTTVHDGNDQIVSEEFSVKAIKL